MTFYIVAAVIFILSIAWWIFEKNTNKKFNEEIGSALTKIDNFDTSTHIIGAGGYGRNGLAVDENRAKILLFKCEINEGNLTHRVIDYADILSSEIFENGQTVVKTVRSNQIGGAIVGGALLGGVGAVIGGLSGKKIERETINRIELRLVVNDPAEPNHDICFYMGETKRDSALYKHFNEQARQWHARMNVLIKRGELEQNAKAPPLETSEQHLKPAAFISDELRKLADLREVGILSEAEFEMQKNKLLS